MAKKSHNFLSNFLLFLLDPYCQCRREFRQVFEKLSPKELGFKREKLSHLHFYFHDIISGKKPTAIQVAGPPLANASSTFFGVVMAIDDPLTVGPELTSKQVGRAQGMYSSASQSELGFMMVLNYVFTEGKYNGSTLSILGRNAALSAVREMPIVGASEFSGLQDGMLRPGLISLISKLVMLLPNTMFMFSIIDVL